VSMDVIKNSDFIISLATCFKNDNEKKILEDIKSFEGQFVFMHPIDNNELKSVYSQFIKYEVGSEEGICTMLLDTFTQNINSNLNDFIEDLDIGYISAESSAGEEEFEEALQKYQEASSRTLIVGSDIKNHPRIENILKLLFVIKKYSDFNLVVLDKEIENSINEINDENVEEIDDLSSYDGTISYFVSNDEYVDNINASQSFSRIAKVQDNDEVYVCFDDKKLKKIFKIDENLSGTVAITNDTCDGYNFKKVKLLKVNA